MLLRDASRDGTKLQAGIRAALVHLEGQVINLACDDIGRHVYCDVLLPMICDRLEDKFEETLCQRKAAIQQAVTLRWGLTIRFVDLFLKWTCICGLGFRNNVCYLQCTAHWAKGLPAVLCCHILKISCVPYAFSWKSQISQKTKPCIRSMQFAPRLSISYKASVSLQL